VCIPLTVGVKLYTLSCPGVLNPQAVTLQPAPLPEKVAVVETSQFSVVMLAHWLQAACAAKSTGKKKAQRNGLRIERIAMEIFIDKLG
jgi:hypothetical protein